MIAALLAAVLIVLVRRLRRRYVDATRGRTPLAGALMLTAAGAVFAVLLVVANIQGALAPLASLFSLLDPAGAHHGPFADVVDQARRGLAATGGERRAPALTAVDDFARVHAVFAIMAATLVAGLLVTALWCRRAAAARSAPSDRRERRLLRVTGGAAVGLALLMLLLTFANVTNALGPEDGLRAFLGS